MSNSKSKGLGRGLSALMANVDHNTAATSDTRVILPSGETNLAIEKIHPNPDQPRRSFTPDDLEDLANSIRTKGVIQPLIVRRHPKKEDEFEIVAGERRWRASQLAQLHEIPAIIRDFSDNEVLEVAIIENIQREDLNPVEEATGYRQLMLRFGRTQEQMAEALGKSRSHIANLLRLLSLPEDVQMHLKEGNLTIGHARALVTTKNASELAQLIISKGLSVRDTENLVKNLLNESRVKRSAPGFKKNLRDKDADTKALEGDLSAAIGMKVEINHHADKDSGEVTISYASLDQLDDICQILNVSGLAAPK